MEMFKTAAELLNSLEYAGGRRGFKDLKDEGMCNVLLGMAQAYLSALNGGCLADMDTGSATLDRVLHELRCETRSAILGELYMDIEATLTNFLDAEAEAWE